jgi:predicted nucleic acid-binding protein
MIVLLDTNVLIDILNNRWGRRAYFTELTDQGATLASCAVTVAEIYAGMRPKEAIITAELLDSLDYYETTASAAKLGGELLAAWAKKGLTLSLTDTLIAAVAMEYRLAIATDNVKDFPMPELQLVAVPRPS